MRFRRLGGFTAVVLVAAVACDEVAFPTPAAEELQATLSGGSVVPAVLTSATGTAVFAATLDSFFIYRLDVAAIDSPTVAHIHEGAAGVGGGLLLLTLYSGPTRGSGYTGPLGSAQLRPRQLTLLPSGYGATAQARYDSLLARIRAGTVYVDVHTRRSPNGELRGQTQRQ